MAGKQSGRAQSPPVAACRTCGTAVYLSHKGDSPVVGGTGPDLSDHWRHIKDNVRHCERGNGAVAEPYDGTGPVAQMLREVLEAPASAPPPEVAS